MNPQKRREPLALLEYAILLGVISMVTIGVVQILRNQIINIFNTTNPPVTETTPCVELETIGEKLSAIRNLREGDLVRIPRGFLQYKDGGREYIKFASATWQMSELQRIEVLLPAVLYTVEQDEDEFIFAMAEFRKQ